MDLDRFEAIPVEALKDLPPSLPTKTFGPEELKKGLRALVEKYHMVFSKSVSREPAKVTPMRIEVDPRLWKLPRNRLPPRNLGKVREEEINRQVDIMLEKGVLQISRASEHSHGFTVPKSSGDWRFVMDLVNLNHATTDGEQWPIPNIGELLRRMGDKRPKFFFVMDLTSGFHQAPIAPDCRHLTAFITKKGMYEWCRVVMGAKTAAPYFQRVISSEVLAGYVQNICELYIDDVITYGNTVEEGLRNLEKILERFQEFGITVNPDKCSFGLNEIEYVGHTINSEGIHFTRDKLDSVVNFPPPRTQHDLKAFVGLVSYFRDHIRRASDLMQPLHDLMKPYHPKQILEWSERDKEVFEVVKRAVDQCPFLYFLDRDLEVVMQTDACNTGMGAYLFQRRADGGENPVAFLSKAFDDRLRKWCTFQQEGFAIYYAMKKWRYLLLDREFTLMTDHANLTYLKGSSDPKVLRWMVSIQEFDFRIKHIKGADNVVADAFSRLCAIRKSNRLRDREESEQPLIHENNTRRRRAQHPTIEVKGSRNSLRLELKKSRKEPDYDDRSISGSKTEPDRMTENHRPKIFYEPSTRVRPGIRPEREELPSEEESEDTELEMNDAFVASTRDEGNARSKEILSHNRETDFPTDALTRTEDPNDIESEGNARDENIESSDRPILLTNGEAESRNL